MATEPAATGEWVDEERLPRGRHNLPRDVVAGHQRRRLLAGTARALATYGFADLTVEDISAVTGVSRATFYEHFRNRRECVLVAHEEAFDRLTGELCRACAREEDWPDKVAAATAAAIGFVARDPDEAHLLLVDAVASDPVLVARVLESDDFLAGLLRRGREECAVARQLPDLTEVALVGAVSSLIGSRVLSGQADRLPGLEADLVQLMLIPYIGVGEAQRVARAQA